MTADLPVKARIDGKMAVVAGAGGALMFLRDEQAASFITGVLISVDVVFSAYSGV